MEITTDLGTYLGMPTLTSRVTKATFSHLCEKIDRRLSGWKTKYLSLAGRLTLAKSTLSTMACYSMQTAKIPRMICDEIDKKTRRFIWGGSEDQRRVHLLSWETLQKPKEHAFLWIAFHDRILGNLTRFKRNMTTDPRCFICGQDEESSLHILRDCAAAKLVWRKIGGNSSTPEFWVNDIKEWITTNIDHQNMFEKEDWPTRFSIVLWWLWRWRNCYVFGRQHEIPVDIEPFLQLRLTETL